MTTPRTARDLTRCVAIVDLTRGAVPIVEIPDFGAADLHGRGPVYTLTVLGDGSISQTWCTGETIAYDRIGDVDESHDGCTDWH